MKATTVKPRLSGFCNPTLPRTTDYDPHQRCPGCDCRAARCPCNPETAMPIDERTAALMQAETVAALEATAENADTLTPAECVEQLHGMAGNLNTSMVGYGPEEWTDALRLLHSLRKVTTVLKQIDSSIATWLYLHGEHGMHQHIDGIPGEFSIGRGRSKERWAAASAVTEYVNRKIEANEGEYPDPLTVIDWVLEVLPATSSTSLRKPALRAMGIDIEEYYASEPGSIQISLP